MCTPADESCIRVCTTILSSFQDPTADPAGSWPTSPGFVEADTSVTAAICLYGYYGPSGNREESPSSILACDATAAPPFFLAHGDQDSLIPVEAARLFAAKLRSVSRSPVVYAELPGAQHGFDRFHSLRFEKVVDGIEAFTAWITSREQAYRPSSIVGG